MCQAPGWTARSRPVRGAARRGSGTWYGAAAALLSRRRCPRSCGTVRGTVSHPASAATGGAGGLRPRAAASLQGAGREQGRRPAHRTRHRSPALGDRHARGCGLGAHGVRAGLCAAARVAVLEAASHGAGGAPGARGCRGGPGPRFPFIGAGRHWSSRGPVCWLRTPCPSPRVCAGSSCSVFAGVRHLWGVSCVPGCAARPSPGAPLCRPVPAG